jgi:GNAT superfamily N-acetyltransferase
MRAWLPERQVYGPEPACERDTEGLNRVFAEAFTDRYRRDGLVGVRVPHLNPQVWRYALLDAGEGALLWRDESGQVAAFNIAHRSGAEGWMGPLAVRPDRQGTGIGKTIVRTAVDWLLERGVTTLGLETMPRTVENIGFYARLGFLPGYLTVTMTNDIATRGHLPAMLLSQRKGDAGPQAIEAARQLVAALAPGADFTREILLTRELGLGDTSLVEGDGGLGALVLWHSAPLAEGRPRDEVRVLKLAARNRASFEAAIAATEAAAARAGIRRVAVRCQTRYADAFRVLVARGYRVRWTDLRMTYDGYPERGTDTGVLFSNWEI